MLGYLLGYYILARFNLCCAWVKAMLRVNPWTNIVLNSHYIIHTWSLTTFRDHVHIFFSAIFQTCAWSHFNIAPLSIGGVNNTRCYVSKWMPVWSLWPKLVKLKPSNLIWNAHGRTKENIQLINHTQRRINGVCWRMLVAPINRELVIRTTLKPNHCLVLHLDSDPVQYRWCSKLLKTMVWFFLKQNRF